MKPAELFHFIGCCLAMDNDHSARQSVEAAVRNSAVPWEPFVWMGSEHLVLPALYSAFKRNNLMSFLPADLAAHLEYIHSLNLERNKKLLQQALNIIQILDSRGIEPVFLKGMGYLLQGLYHDRGDRMMMDIDLLISGNEISTAASLLRKNGYVSDAEDREEDFSGHHHLPGLFHPDEPAFVELHRTPLPSGFDRFLPVEAVINEKIKTEFPGTWVLSPTHQIMLHFLHDQLHDKEFLFRSFKLKGLYDFYLLSLRFPDAQQAARKYLPGRRFTKYCSYVAEVFPSGKRLKHSNLRFEKAFSKQHRFLLNHPKFNAFYYRLIYNLLRIKKVIRLFTTAPLSKQSRRYIRRKIGSSEARKTYFTKLKKEFGL